MCSHAAAWHAWPVKQAERSLDDDFFRKRIYFLTYEGNRPKGLDGRCSSCVGQYCLVQGSGGDCSSDGWWADVSSQPPRIFCRGMSPTARYLSLVNRAGGSWSIPGRSDMQWLSRWGVLGGGWSCRLNDWLRSPTDRLLPRCLAEPNNLIRWGFSYLINRINRSLWQAKKDHTSWLDDRVGFKTFFWATYMFKTFKT